jgi:putative membrane protein
MRAAFCGMVLCSAGLVACAKTSSESGSTAGAMSDAGTRAETAAAAPPLSADDAAFLKKAAEANLAEISLGKLAVERGSRQDVKQYGQRMIDDHTKANAELTTLAQAKRVTVPSEPDAEHLAAAKKLSSLTAPAFDNQFATLMHTDHVKVVALFEEKAKDATDPDVRAFAAKTLPTLQQHLQSATALHGKEPNIGR